MGYTQSPIYFQKNSEYLKTIGINSPDGNESITEIIKKDPVNREMLRLKIKKNSNVKVRTEHQVSENYSAKQERPSRPAPGSKSYAGKKDIIKNLTKFAIILQNGEPVFINGNLAPPSQQPPPIVIKDYLPKSKIPNFEDNHELKELYDAGSIIDITFEQSRDEIRAKKGSSAAVYKDDVSAERKPKSIGSAATSKKKSIRSAAGSHDDIEMGMGMDDDDDMLSDHDIAETIGADVDFADRFTLDENNENELTDEEKLRLEMSASLKK